jgi:ADP-heptose:LPS heptosyltransferase
LKTPKHILVIRLSALGDVAMTVPVLKVFSETYPDIKLTVLSKAIFNPLFADLPNTDFLEADVYGKHKGIGLLKLANVIKSLGIDAVADLHNVIRSNIITQYLRVSGIKTIRIDNGRSEKKALTREINKNFRQLKSTHQRYADVFSLMGLPIDLNKNIPAPSKDFTPKFQEIIGIAPKKIIGIAPFAAFKSKMYPLELMRKVISRLDSIQEYKILLFGGGEEEIAILKNLESDFTSVNSIAGILSFKEELALISNLDLMVSMDSGNGHLAAIFGVPVVSLWGLTHPFAGFAPMGQSMENNLLADRSKYPLIPTSIYGNKFPDGYEDAIKTISSKTVVGRILEILR